MKKGWQTKRVGEIAQHSLGKMLDRQKNRGEPQPYLRNLNVRWGEFDLSDLLEMRFLPEEAEKYTAVRGDVLVCEGGYPGRAAIWDRDEPIYFQKALHRVRFHEPERNRWFVYYLQFRDLKGTLRQHFNGVGIQHFTGEALAQFELPIPPLAEQRRIVGVLDEAFAGFATAQTNAAKNLQNARALFESYLDAVFSQRGPRWEEKRLGDLCDLITKGTTPTSVGHSFVPDGINFVKVESINRDGEFLSSRIARITQECHDELRRSQLMAGDILFSIAGALGRTAVVTEEILPANTNQALAILRLKPSLSIVPGFVRAVLSAKSALDQIEAFRGGAAQQNLSLAQVREFLIPLPSPAEQRRVVSALNEIAAETQRLTRLYEQKQAALAELKKSLLQQAFTGNL